MEVFEGRYRKLPNRREDNWVWSPQGAIDMHRPERWGFVQFTRATSGRVPFRSDQTLPARDFLMAVYHAQKAFHQRHRRWAATLEELGLVPPTGLRLLRPPDLHVEGDRFEAVVEVRLTPRDTRRLTVRHDSRLWESRVSERGEDSRSSGGNAGSRAHARRVEGALTSDPRVRKLRPVSGDPSLQPAGDVCRSADRGRPRSINGRCSGELQPAAVNPPAPTGAGAPIAGVPAQRVAVLRVRHSGYLAVAEFRFEPSTSPAGPRRVHPGPRSSARESDRPRPAGMPPVPAAPAHGTPQEGRARGANDPSHRLPARKAREWRPNPKHRS